MTGEAATTSRPRRRQPSTTKSMVLFTAAAQVLSIASRPAAAAAAAAFSPAASAVRAPASERYRRRSGRGVGVGVDSVGGLARFASSSAESHDAGKGHDDDDNNAAGPGTAVVLRPLIVCGPSGVGKGTIIERFMSPSGPYDGSSRFAFTVSHTTRDPRPGEVDGTHYHFTDHAAMRDDIAEGGKFLEHAEVHGNLYGTSMASLEAVQADGGKVPLLDIDVQGVRSVKAAREARDAQLEESRQGSGGPPDAILRPRFVFVAPPSPEALRERLKARGTETEKSLARRTVNAEAELEYGLEGGNFDRIVVNNDLDEACEEFDRVVRSLYDDDTATGI